MKRIIKHSLAAVMLLVLLTVSCEKEYFQPPVVSLSETQSFKKVILPILTKNCIDKGCHTVNGGVVPYLDADLAFESLSNGNYCDTPSVKKSVLYIKIALEKSKPMPPKNKLSPTDVALIKAWIDQGAQNN